MTTEKAKANANANANAGKKKTSRLVVAALAAAGIPVVLVLFATGGTILGVILSTTLLAIFSWRLTRPSPDRLVGKTCAHCSDGIFIEAHADRCASCSEPLHARCIDAHAKTHAASAASADADAHQARG